MDINLLSESMLGHWSISAGVQQCEFQFGRLLIYVQHPHNEPPATRLAAAQREVQAAWDDLPHAIAFAEKHCKTQMPELMRLYETHMPGKSPLLVYSIHFNMGSPYPSYYIARNHDFDWGRVLVDEDEQGLERDVCVAQFEPEDNFWVSVKRVGFQQFEL
ncbi:hypothetical protein HX866_06035 [Pseudomonas gingeri]|uniref:hypothetical protein n=1 Tax=Pseudomonas gingeri TaxID=117681 RepID=UPI00159FBF6A|nr:hypothetical protein [Pseudomonas gingeri]NWA24442.1 hypothetical protein [Pseudomonas gingeri]